MKILAIKFKFLGDVAITVTALRALRQAYPNAELHFLVSEEAIPVIEHIPWINKVWGYPRKKSQGTKKKAFSIIKTLRKEKFDLSVDFVGNDRGAWISLLICAKIRLGPISTRGFWGRKYCYTHRIAEAPNDIHETERELHLLSRIGIQKPNSMEPELYSDPNLRAYAQAILPENPILCHISASSASKEWPVSKWIEFYKESPELQSQLVFTSGANTREKELLKRLHSVLPGAQVIMKTPSISELMALIDAAEAVVCGDTFTSHAAAGLGTPLVVLFGPTQVRQWDPQGNSVIIETDWCKCQHFFYKCTNTIHCLSMLPISRVREALIKLLGKIR